MAAVETPAIAVIPSELFCLWPCLEPSTLRAPWKPASSVTPEGIPLYACSFVFLASHPTIRVLCESVWLAKPRSLACTAKRDLESDFPASFLK